MENKILVSICLITYNHKQFIAQAIESALAQRTNFEFDLVIADDFSKDGTRDILKAYKEKYPRKIHLILQDKNVGAAQNWKDLICYPQNKYIAYFEGDDYWIDPFKLQKQIDFLEAKPIYSMCYTNLITVDETGKILNNSNMAAHQARDISHEDMLANNCFISSATIVFRKESFTPCRELFEAPNGDYFLFYLLTKSGPAGYLEFNSAAYRIHSSGIWNSKNIIQKNWASYRTFLLAKRVFTEKSEVEALKINLNKILKMLFWEYLQLPMKERLIFIFKSFFISLRFGVFSTWLGMNSTVISLFLKSKVGSKTIQQTL